MLNILKFKKVNGGSIVETIKIKVINYKMIAKFSLIINVIKIIIKIM